MSDKERLNAGPEAYDAKALAEAGREHQERLRENRERAAEKGHENAAEAARHEALEQASRVERESRSHEKREESPAERRGPASKRERDASYDRTMREVRSQMSAPSRVFSSVIHNPVVEKISDVVGGTIARPNAIASGALFAFGFTLAIYLIAHFNGYPLSGTESIASFVVGWLIGLVYDYFKLLITGKK
ncbi:MAG: hypothetical protein KDA17_03020 [Candidatus Saccharibacteria bacterium]|nr:hypothetical protein [Candidatus Saccharibacteria bacterium]